MRHHRITAAAAAAVAALTLAACGSSSSTTATSTSPATTSPSMAATTPAASSPPAAAGTLVEVAAANPDFTTLVAAVKAAGLVDTLNGPGPFTVFAPTNKAFAALPADVPHFWPVISRHFRGQSSASWKARRERCSRSASRPRSRWALSNQAW